MYTNKELRELLQTSKHRRIVFIDGDYRVELPAKLLGTFIDAGRGSDQQYKLSILQEDYTYLVRAAYTETRREYQGYGRYNERKIDHPAVWGTAKAGEALVIEYTGTLKGRAVFRSVLGEYITQKKLAWFMERTLFIDFRNLTVTSEVDPATQMKGRKQTVVICTVEDGTRCVPVETVQATVYGHFALMAKQKYGGYPITHVPTGLMVCAAETKDAALKVIAAYNAIDGVAVTCPQAASRLVAPVFRELQSKGLATVR